MTDVHHAYKNALHRAYAKDAVEKDEERRIANGKPAFSEEEYAERVDTHGQSPWHFTGQASLDLNAHFAILSTRANPITVANYPYVPKTHSGILIHPRA